MNLYSLLYQLMSQVNRVYTVIPLKQFLPQRSPDITVSTCPQTNETLKLSKLSFNCKEEVCKGECAARAVSGDLGW